MSHSQMGRIEQGQSSDVQDKIVEMRAIIDNLKRENEYLRMYRSGWVRVRSNLASLSTYAPMRRRR